MTSTTPTTRTDPYLDQLAYLIAAHGILDFEGDIARLIVRLRSEGHCDLLIDVLADHGAPAVARERAFGHLLGTLARGPAKPKCAAA